MNEPRHADLRRQKAEKEVTRSARREKPRKRYKIQCRWPRGMSLGRWWTCGRYVDNDDMLRAIQTYHNKGGWERKIEYRCVLPSGAILVIPRREDQQ